MRRIKSKDTTPEMRVRRLAHGMGFRYRLHRKDLPGKPDLVFPARRKVIFVHGCFWHQHSDPDCRIARVPKSRTDYWLPKLGRNVAKDAKHIQDLRQLGWQVLVVWECQTEDAEQLRPILLDFLEKSE